MDGMYTERFASCSDSDKIEIKKLDLVLPEGLIGVREIAVNSTPSITGRLNSSGPTERRLCS